MQSFFHFHLICSKSGFKKHITKDSCMLKVANIQHLQPDMQVPHLHLMWNERGHSIIGQNKQQVALQLSQV